MLTPNMAANPSPAHGPSEEVRPATGYGREFRRPLPLAFLILAVLGWLAAAYSFWRAPDGQESQGKAPAGHSEVEATRAVTEADQKLATASSALTATIRLRDEAAQSLQEVRERSAGVGKDTRSGPRPARKHRTRPAIATSRPSTNGWKRHGCAKIPAASGARPPPLLLLLLLLPLLLLLLLLLLPPPLR